MTGAKLAERLDDPKAAEFYRAEAATIAKVLEKFWSEEKGIVRVTLNHTKGAFRLFGIISFSCTYLSWWSRSRVGRERSRGRQPLRQDERARRCYRSRCTSLW